MKNWKLSFYFYGKNPLWDCVGVWNYGMGFYMLCLGLFSIGLDFGVGEPNGFPWHYIAGKI
jgi:hypothetical protein